MFLSSRNLPILTGCFSLYPSLLPSLMSPSWTIYGRVWMCRRPTSFPPGPDRVGAAPGSGRYEPSIYENDYRVVMRLTIKSVEMQDFGSYRCVAKNSLGETDGVIKLYRKWFPINTFSSWLHAPLLLLLMAPFLLLLLPCCPNRLFGQPASYDVFSFY